MTVSWIIELIDLLADTALKVAPLIAEGRTLLSETDAARIHDALNKAESATAALRPQVDAALSKAAAS